MRSPILLIALFLSAKLLAQGGSNEKLKPLILIDTLFTYNESMIIHPSNIISISTLTASKATQLYGITGKFGLIRIQTAPDIHFARLTEILDLFKIEEKYRNLRVCIDRTMIAEPGRILADLKQIRNVEIIMEKNLSSAPESFINIITEPG